MKEVKTINELLENKAKIDNAMMRGLKVKEIGHHIAWTDRGDLLLRIRSGQGATNYQFYLDAVPVTEIQNKQLIKLYFNE